MTDRNVEIAAIKAADAYAKANGYEGTVAAGLVLTGMAIAVLSDEKARRAFLRGYLAAFPDAEPALRGWALWLDAAAER